MAQAMFGAGCFWGVEYNFSKVEGVNEVVSGYSGGKTENPTYEQVCSNTTDHAEVVLIEFNQDEISFEELLNHFWSCHNPTTLNRQGPDIGTQYRSVIFYFNDYQKNIAEFSKQNYSKDFNLNIVTEISEVKEYYKAEEYHQKYIQKTGLHCAI